MTYAELMKRLETLSRKQGTMPVRVMIEANGIQYDYEATDLAVGERDGKPYLTIMREEP